MIESEGERQFKINIAEGKKMSQILRAEGNAEALIKKAEASANALKTIWDALKSNKGQDAANFLLGERYIEAYRKIAAEKNTVILNSSPTSLVENVSESFNLLEKIHQDDKTKIEVKDK